VPRRVPLRQFITGVRTTVLAPGELVVAIHVPRPRHDATSAFLKLGARRYLVISITMAAAVLEFADERVAAARIAVGACSPVAERLPALEAALIGAARGDLVDCVDAAQLAPLSPIDDVRGSAAYRRDAVVTVLRRLLAGFAS
jgi:CO/xanthine dehydrogenase FAD-binding subunit